MSEILLNPWLICAYVLSSVAGVWIYVRARKAKDDDWNGAV